MGEYEFIIKKKKSKKQIKITTEDLETYLEEELKEWIEDLPWYLKWVVKLALDKYGESISFLLDKIIEDYYGI